MADEFSITMTADDRDLMQSYVRQADKINKLQEQLKRWQKEAMEAGRASKKAAEDGAKGADRMIRGVAGVAAGWLSATGAVSAFMQANRQAIADSERHAEVMDDITRKFRIQSGMRGLQGQQAQTSILKNAYRAGVTKDQAFAAGTQLVSSGMDGGEANGAGLRAFLDVLGASNQTGKNVDGEGLSKALMQYLESQGMAKTGGNVSKIGGQIQTLFKSTNLQLSGLPFLAKEGAGLATALSPEEQLGAFAKLTGSFDESSSATSLRSIVQRLQTARTKKDATRSLKEMGLSTDDVDFVGENLDTVLGKLKGGLDKVPENRRAGLLKTIFEEQGIAPALALMNGRADVARNVAMQKDLSGFEADVRHSQEGRGAAGRRMDLEQEIGLAESASTYGMRRKAHQNALLKAGYSPFLRSIAGGGYDLASGLGLSPESAQGVADWAANPSSIAERWSGHQGRQFVQRETETGLQRALDPAGFLASQQELARALRENTEATKANTPIAPKGIAAPGPRPTAGAGRP